MQDSYTHRTLTLLRETRVEVWWGGVGSGKRGGGIIAAGRVNTDVMLSEKNGFLQQNSNICVFK